MYFGLQTSLSFDFQMDKSTDCGVVEEVCEAIWEALQPEYVKMPSCEEQWLAVSKDYEEI